MCYIGRRGRQGGIPREVSRIAEEYQRNIQPPYDKDDIISAFENGFMKSQGKITNQNYREMKKIDNMLLVAVVVVLGMANLAGLGNAAVETSIYWVPFIIDIPFFVYVCYKLVKAGDITAKPSDKEESGAAHPAQGENVKEDTISDK